ncbi:asparagine synthetase A [Microbulbifer sp. THAF38]|uniref:asparagine synthetase A n=1 Tax=Microbulbifer sp. THAF38 TaxID=2587856 RepID=UPI0012AA448F|nr:asparagine synthetase A [Microbulbifer sp. THAF38]QFT56158.1 Asparagine--tRNA ligase [Microbulbifer sp. THAF38]
MDTDNRINSWQPPALADPARYLKLTENPWFNLLVDLQDIITRETAAFWKKRSIGTVHLPVTTGSISSPNGLGSDSMPVRIQMDGHETYLADSMQFHLELCCRMKPQGVYYLMPSFRGEDWDTTHLCQFMHSEVEINGGLHDAMALAESYIRSLCNAILAEQAEPVLNAAGNLSHLEELASGKLEFKEITFDKAADLLREKPGLIQSTKYGRHLTREGERELIKTIGPFVWVTKWDHGVVPFYQALDKDGHKALNADLLFGCGEVIGCGERHIDHLATLEAMQAHGINPELYEWYTNMKQQCPKRTAGFGMGVERFLMWVLNHDDIRDLQILPRRNGFELTP